VEDKTEYYEGPISVKFTGLPSVKLVSVILNDGAKWYQKLAEATRRRSFTLEKEWRIELDRVSYAKEINGTVIIPKSVQDELILFDGASVPMPWFVSFLSIGILRPLGIMLTASIVHDFAYKFGCLLVLRKGEEIPTRIPVQRHHVDRLFRDIISTVNGIGFFGWIAWYFVRIGWIAGVKYDGQYFGGKKPIGVALFSVIFGLVLCFGLATFHNEGHSIEFMISFIFLFNVILSLLCTLILHLTSLRVE
jgi:fumarate reductase subunit C